MKRLISIVLVFVLLFAFASLVHAEDASTPLTPGLDAVPTTPGGYIAVFTFFAGSLAVSGLVGLLKMFLPESISADTLKEWTAVAVSIVYLALLFTGHGDWFASGSDLFNQLLPFVTGFIGVLQGSRGVHKIAESVGLPLFGFNRS